jgi:hypothetical protein
MSYISKDLDRNQVNNIFKNLTGDSFDVNEQKLPQYRNQFSTLMKNDETLM